MTSDQKRDVWIVAVFGAVVVGIAWAVAWAVIGVAGAFAEVHAPPVVAADTDRQRVQVVDPFE